MMDTSGFYFADGQELLLGPNFVEGPTFSLHRDNPDDRDNTLNGSATHGWHWFETEAEAQGLL